MESYRARYKSRERTKAGISCSSLCCNERETRKLDNFAHSASHTTQSNYLMSEYCMISARTSSLHHPSCSAMVTERMTSIARSPARRNCASSFSANSRAVSKAQFGSGGFETVSSHASSCSSFQCRADSRVPLQQCLLNRPDSCLLLFWQSYAVLRMLALAYGHCSTSAVIPCPKTVM